MIEKIKNDEKIIALINPMTIMMNPMSMVYNQALINSMFGKSGKNK